MLHLRPNIKGVSEVVFKVHLETLSKEEGVLLLGKRVGGKEDDLPEEPGHPSALTASTASEITEPSSTGLTVSEPGSGSRSASSQSRERHMNYTRTTTKKVFVSLEAQGDADALEDFARPDDNLTWGHEGADGIGGSVSSGSGSASGGDGGGGGGGGGKTRRNKNGSSVSSRSSSRSTGHSHSSTSHSSSSGGGLGLTVVYGDAGDDASGGSVSSLMSLSSMSAGKSYSRHELMMNKPTHYKEDFKAHFTPNWNAASPSDASVMSTGTARMFSNLAKHKETARLAKIKARIVVKLRAVGRFAVILVMVY